MKIRPFELDDVPAMIELGSEMHRESSFSHLDYNFEKLMQMGRMYKDNPEMFFSQVAVDEHGKIYAMYVGRLTQYYFGTDLVAVDELVFVRPDRRGGLAAARLIKGFETWAIEAGASEIRPASSTGVYIDQTRKLYEALGFETVGHTFRKVIK